ncbi:ABC transporter substrate-binding protein [Pseudomonas sp. REP124]|uniref:ABC transporter substrate-binding protein n=1 Tax=Pseudomonas sp. REP124 TaxID=2875731 RepID=UPI00398CD457
MSALLWTTPVLAGDYRNCGQNWTLAHSPPQRVLALNQHAADLILALEGAPTLVGVAYLDDNGDGETQDDYFGVPVIASKYPSSEVLYAQKPDLIVGGFASAFGQGITSRIGLAKNGIASYLLESACNGHSLDYFGHIHNDLLTLGHLLHKQQRARELIDEMDADLLSAQAATRPGKPISVFYLDSEINGLDSEGKRGFVTTLLAAAGARNVFAEVDQYRVTVSSETLLVTDPDVILLADAIWSPATRKRQLLRGDPVLSKLRAVRENRLIDIPFTHVMPTFASGRSALELAERLKNMSAD